jgi:hypothetical protein
VVVEGRQVSEVVVVRLSGQPGAPDGRVQPRSLGLPVVRRPVDDPRMDMSEIGSDWDEVASRPSEQGEIDYVDRLAREEEAMVGGASRHDNGLTLESDDPRDADFGADQSLDSGDDHADQASDSDPDGSSDAPADGYNPLAAAREDLSILVSALDDVSHQLANLVETLREQSSESIDRQPDLENQLVLAEQIAPTVSQLKGVAEELVADGLDQTPDLAFTATAQMTALQSEVRYARKRYRANRAWGKIWGALKRIAPRLWSLISHLVKVKEWSVTGQVGTGVLGLAQASIRVTFGQ